MDPLNWQQRMNVGGIPVVFPVRVPEECVDDERV